MVGQEKQLPNNVRDYLLNICSNLAMNTCQQIEPHTCLFEPTEHGAQYHYRIIGGRPSVIAWAGLRTRGRQVDTIRRPCVIIGVKGNLLNGNDRIISRLQWKPNANYRSKESGGSGEWQGTIYEIGDKGYQLMSYALIMATRECLRRASQSTGLYKAK